MQYNKIKTACQTNKLGLLKLTVESQRILLLYLVCFYKLKVLHVEGVI